MCVFRCLEIDTYKVSLMYELNTVDFNVKKERERKRGKKKERGRWGGGKAGRKREVVCLVRPSHVQAELPRSSHPRGEDRVAGQVGGRDRQLMKC